MLYRQRKEASAKAAREAAGESLWTKEFSPTLRNRVWIAFGDSFRLVDPFGMANPWNDICSRTRSRLLHDSGSRGLGHAVDAGIDLDQFLQTCDDDDVCSVIEAMALTIRVTEWKWLDGNCDFTSAINDALYRERAAYELIDQTMIEKDSEELHAEVVEPVLRLLAGRVGWSDVESSYQDALRELANDKADDAITDAARALQGALTQLGCEGNSLGSLVTSAKKKGLLAAHDPTLASGIVKFIEWASADRSEMGDGHVVSNAVREDAWLAVHIVGALILRLAGPMRDTPEAS